VEVKVKEEGGTAVGEGGVPLLGAGGEADDALDETHVAEKMFCFFATQGKRVGWVMARKGKRVWWVMPRKVGGKKVVAFCPKKGRLPPEAGWQVKEGGAFQADPAVLTRKEMGREELIEALCAREKASVQAAQAAAAEEAKKQEEGKEGKEGGGEDDRKEGFELSLEVLAAKEGFARSMQVLGASQVICSQMITAGGALLSRLGQFAAILVDEVAQCTELGAIVPIVQRGCSRLVLAGDHCQLPPNVQSQEAERRGLSLSLYGRLVRLGLEPFFLDTQ
ncbi:AAA domain-containing protein, partial [Baffinella frigidus]